MQHTYYAILFWFLSSPIANWSAEPLASWILGEDFEIAAMTFLSWEVKDWTYCFACNVEKKPAATRNAMRTLSIFFILFSPSTPIFCHFCDFYAIYLAKKGKQSAFFAFPGYIRLRPDRGCSGANPPNYKEDYTNIMAENAGARKRQKTYPCMGPFAKPD